MQTIVTHNPKQYFLRKVGQTEKSPDMWNDSSVWKKETHLKNQSECSPLKEFYSEK